MRPRFSLRWLLIGFTIVSVAFYVAIIRPTAMAQRFVVAIERNDFDAAHSLLREDDRRISIAAGKLRDRVGPIDRMFIEIFPRNWQDLWACQRRLLLRTARHDDTNGRYVDWTEDTEIVAGIAGLQVIPPRIEW
jgi:hypothetical protein